MWYQITSMLTEQAIDLTNGPAKGPALGCWHKKPTTGNSAAAKERMTVMQALQALHKQADRNHDGKISDHEILDIFQGVRDHLSSSDFGYFLDMVNKLHGPINCD